MRDANQIVGNPETLCGLEMTIEGTTLRAYKPCTVAVTGAVAEVLIDTDKVSMYKAL